jgi:regulator of replication initiation timing
METNMGNSTISQEGAKPKIQSSPFKPRPTLLLDVTADGGVRNSGHGETSEGMLHQLLINTEVSAQLTQASRMKWQLATLALGMLFAITIAVTIWLYIETKMTGTQREGLQAENRSIKKQLNVAETQITGFKGETETLLNRNIELAGENSQLKSLKKSAIAPAPVVTEVRQPVENPRIEAIRKGTYPEGTTRDELINALGEPDRVYKSDKYEQLVYFDKKPGRFWFADKWLVRTAE